jgi:Glycosyl transferases group 1
VNEKLRRQAAGSHNLNGKNDSIRLVVAIPPQQFFGGNDRENALALIEPLKSAFPHIFLFDCDIYLSGSDREFAAQNNAAKQFRPNVGMAVPNACYGMILDKRDSYRTKTFWEKLASFRRRTPRGNVFADELGVKTILLWDHVITHAAQFLIGYPPVERANSCSGSLEKLRQGLNHKNFIHYVPDSGHIDVLDRLGIWDGTAIQRYVVPSQNIFLSKDRETKQDLIRDRVLFAGNLNSSQVMSAFGNDPVVAEVTDYVTNVKCKEWGTAAWHAYEKIASQKVAAGISELHPDHSFFWSLGRELITNVVTTAFRTTVFESINTPIDFYGGFTDPEFVANQGRSGLFRPMGSVPLESLGGIYSRYEFSIDITHTPFIHGSNAKVLNCFAAGGFMFVDWKDDLRGALGDLAEEFMYRDAEDLNSKMDHLKGNPAKRLEVIQAVREAVAKDFNFLALQTDVIRKAALPFPAQGVRIAPT